MVASDTVVSREFGHALEALTQVLRDIWGRLAAMGCSVCEKVGCISEK